MWFLSVVGKHTVWLRRTITIPLALYLAAYMISWPITIFRCGLPVKPIDIINKLDCNLGPDLIQYVANTLAVLNSLTDWIFALAPLYLISRAAPGMQRGTKISAVAVVALAIAASLISIARIPFQNNGAKFGPHWLGNRLLTIAYILALTETAVASATISLATLQPLLSVARRRWRLKGDRYGADLDDTPERRKCERARPLDSTSVLVTTTNKFTNESIDLQLSALGALGVFGSLLMTVREEERREDESSPVAVGRGGQGGAGGGSEQEKDIKSEAFEPQEDRPLGMDEGQKRDLEAQ